MQPPFASSRTRSVDVKSFHETAGHDIGNETPTEILREGELCVELLSLYFDNFSDIHFLFEREAFLRSFIVDSCHKGIIYAMLALGIRCVEMAALLYGADSLDILTFN